MINGLIRVVTKKLFKNCIVLSYLLCANSPLLVDIADNLIE